MPDQRQPDQELLQQLLLGQLPSAEAERLSIEYAEDSRLAELAESIVAQDDTLVSQLKEHDTVADSGTDRLVQRLQQRLQAVLPSRPQEVTAILSAADSVADQGAYGASAPLTQTLPERLEYYRPTGVLGQGGMGTVYLALDTRLGREVALKTLRPELAAHPQAKERFLREARTAARLDHDNVIPIYYVGESDGTPFLAMPLLKGEPLDAAMVRTVGPFSIPEVIRIARETASGLAAAHRLGLIHRDIKPGNIWLEAPSGRVKILDFGLAKAADTGDAMAQTQMTANGAIVGTPAYMAPEQAAGRQVDARADLFSLGCVMYQLLTAKRPFTGPDMMAVLSNLATHTPPAPHTVNSKCPEDLSRLTMQLLEKDPAKRPESAVAVIQALDKVNLQAPTIAPSPRPAVVQRSAGQRNRVGLIALVALLLAGVGGYFFGGTIIRIATNKGELVVEVDDPDVRVQLVPDGFTVEGPGQGKFTLTAGEGEIEVQQKDGIKLKTKKFELTRGGVTTVKVTLEEVADARKPRGATPDKGPGKSGPTQVAGKQPEVQPKPAVGTAPPAKPFVVTRKGEPTGTYGTLYGALSTLADGDVIEVHSSGPVALAVPEPIAKALHLRAGKGYRPLLVMKQRTLIQGALTIEGCDVDHRAGDWMPQGPLTVAWEFRRCRFWGGTVGYLWTPRLTVEDCVFDTAIGFEVNSKAATEVTITNSAVQCTQHFLVFSNGTAPVAVHLSGNTIRLRHRRLLARIDPAMKAAIAIKADGNVIEFRDRAANQGVNSLIGGDKWQTRLDWVGRDNLYCGNWYAEVAADGKVLGEGLAAWNKLWKQPETNSREISFLYSDGARSSDWSAPDRVAQIRAMAEQMEIPRGQKDLGPDWELVGVGDNYVRALAAQGKEVSQDRLRPDPHADGPIVILRKEAESKGFMTLVAALEVAESGDVVEIRTDEPIPGAEWEGKSRRLTLRAAPGYTPIINSKILTAQDRLVLEGLTFRASVATTADSPWSASVEESPIRSKGAFERVSNCVFLEPEAMQVWGWFRGAADETPEITNCVLGLVSAGIPAGKTLRIKNSVLAGALNNVEKQKAPARLEISNCCMWQADAATTWAEWSVHSRSPLTVDSKSSVFLTSGSLVAVSDVRHLAGWTGSHNVYIKPGEFVSTADSGRLEDWQKSRKTDTDSIELRPFSFEARNWRIWRERSTGYEPRAAGGDFGVDVDRLVKGFTVEQLATPAKAIPEVSKAGPKAAPAKPFVVVRKDQSTGEFGSLFGALSTTAPGDVIEVHANGPVLLTMPEPITKALRLRAGKGFRPLLVLKESLVANAELSIEGCDVDHRTGFWGSYGPVAAWEFRRCRFWGRDVGVCQAVKLVVEDCIFDMAGGFTLTPLQPTEIAITNSAIATSIPFLSFTSGTAPATVQMRGNTFRFRHFGRFADVHFLAKSAIKFEATNNLFDFSLKGHPDCPVHYHPCSDGKENFQRNVEWVGTDNLYSGTWRGDVASQPVPDPARLAAWSKRWQRPEQNSQDIAAIYFAGARTGEWSSPELASRFQALMEQMKFQSNLRQLGPDWSLVGVGEGYVRALAARGQAVPQHQLRPAAHADGPVVILRQDKELNGFLTLKAAVEAAESGDVIEIRTDDPLPGAEWDGKARRLTLRAAPGYAPSITSAIASTKDRLILEGLTFQGTVQCGGNPPWGWKGAGAPFAFTSCIERMTNCVSLNLDAVQVSGWFRGDGEEVPEISNCVLQTVAAGLAGGKTLRVKNSLLATLWMSADGQQAPGQLDITDSVLWDADQSAATQLNHPIHTESPLAVTARSSVLASAAYLVQPFDVKHIQGWTGNHNVYIKPGEFLATSDSGRLADWQKARKTDSDSVELRPFNFDAKNWSVWRERSPDYKPRADGADFGVDIARLVKAFTIEQPATTGQVQPEVSSAGPTADRAKPFVVLNSEGRVRTEFRYAAEALAVLGDGEVLEVHGNGPFKMPAVVREKKSLHLRAGAGYRPRFVPVEGLDKGDWVKVTDAPLTVEGCDLVSNPSDLALFASSGASRCSILDCRLIVPASHTGVIMHCWAKELVIRDSVIACNSAYQRIAVGPETRVECHRNIVLGLPAFLTLQPHAGQRIELSSNTIYEGGAIHLKDRGPETGLATVVAHGNVFTGPTIAWTQDGLDLKQQLQWQGAQNVYVGMQAGPLWHSFAADGGKDAPKSIQEWNAYWKTPGDIQKSERRFGWDFFADPNWEAGLAGLKTELAATKKRHPKLTQLGPNFDLVGSGPAYERTRRLEPGADQDAVDRPDALEGGPFVLLREGKTVLGFPALQTAMSAVKDGDVIEIRSDGPFGSVQANAAPATRLTLRAGRGYRPEFDILLLGYDQGDWILEGLHFRGDKQLASLTCAARRLANCTFAASPVEPLVGLSAAGKNIPVEIVNCFIAGGLVVNSPQTTVSNSAIRMIYSQSTEECSLTLTRSVLWTQHLGVTYSISADCRKSFHVSSTHCLFDSPCLLSSSIDPRWQGSRNVYRVTGPRWSEFLREGKSYLDIYTLKQWRELWKSDADSVVEDSVLFDRKMW